MSSQSQFCWSHVGLSDSEEEDRAGCQTLQLGQPPATDELPDLALVVPSASSSCQTLHLGLPPPATEEPPDILLGLLFLGQPPGSMGQQPPENLAGRRAAWASRRRTWASLRAAWAAHCRTLHLGQPPGSLGQPPENLGQQLPDKLGQPPENSGQPPENLGQPPASEHSGHLPDNLSQPCRSIAHGVPDDLLRTHYLAAARLFRMSCCRCSVVACHCLALPPRPAVTIRWASSSAVAMTTISGTTACTCTAPVHTKWLTIGRCATILSNEQQHDGMLHAVIAAAVPAEIHRLTSTLPPPCLIIYPRLRLSVQR